MNYSSTDKIYLNYCHTPYKSKAPAILNTGATLIFFILIL